jgi:hypothetical protein
MLEGKVMNYEQNSAGNLWWTWTVGPMAADSCYIPFVVWDWSVVPMWRQMFMNPPPVIQVKP